MTSLALRLQKRFVSTSMGAVATLRQVADEKNNSITHGKRMVITIPANNGTNTREVAVDPGRWLVEATLPSGEMISEEVFVAKGSAIPVTLQSADHSPREWLGWQHLIGNIEGEAGLRRLRVRAESALDEAAGRIRSAAERSVFESVGEFGEDLAKLALRKSEDVPSVKVSARPGLEGKDAWTAIWNSDQAAAAVMPSHEDSETATWLYRMAGPQNLAQRHFAYVDWLGERYAISLPLPWKALADGVLVESELMVRRPSLKSESKIGLIVADPEFAPMAGLMTAATLSKASIAVRQAYDMLFAKKMNPLGAAAGGYVLLAAGESEEKDWHHWIDNLNNWFESVPDGAILKASLRLRFPQNENSHAEAYDALLEAFDRGIPYYSAGVSWLLDGLSLFAEERGVEEKLKLVHRVALRLDLSQAFTCIRVSEKAKR